MPEQVGTISQLEQERREEPTPTRLEQHRFMPSHASAELMRSMRKNLSELPKELQGVVQGLSFIGSRTIGREKETSDLDTIVFYDDPSAHALKDQLRSLSAKIPDEQGNVAINSQWRELFLKYYQQDKAVKTKIEQEYTRQLKRLNLPVGYTDFGRTKMNTTVVVIDISEYATGDVLNKFMRAVDEQTENWTKPAEPREENPLAYNLASRFFFALGDGVYRSRQYILDQLKANPNGQHYFDALMQYVQYYERTSATEKRTGLVPYEHRPQTIAEGEKYFARKPVKVSRPQQKPLREKATS